MPPLYLFWWKADLLWPTAHYNIFTSVIWAWSIEVSKPISKHDFNLLKVWSPVTAKIADTFVFGMDFLNYFLSLVCRLLLYWHYGWCWTSKSSNLLQSKFLFSRSFTKSISIHYNHFDQISKKYHLPNQISESKILKMRYHKVTSYIIGYI